MLLEASPRNMHPMSGKTGDKYGKRKRMLDGWVVYVHEIIGVWVRECEPHRIQRYEHVTGL